jgi:hypothetical protein
MSEEQKVEAATRGTTYRGQEGMRIADIGSGSLAASRTQE